MRTLILTALGVLALADSAVSQTTTMKPTTPAAAKPAMAAAKPATTGAVGRKPMTPQSKACSAQADTKGLHGKDREKFRRSCLKGA